MLTRTFPILSSFFLLLGYASSASAALHDFQKIDAVGSIECPAGWTPEVVGLGKLCTRGTNALGPFPEAMVSKCIEWGGGEFCSLNKWDRSLAIGARGEDVCPEGSVWDAVTTYCVEGSSVYGPFPARLVERCRASGGGPACDGARWSRSFLIELMGAEARRNRATVLPVECPTGWTWMAIGDMGGGLCVSYDQAVGPFPKAMVEACKAYAGDSCATLMNWSRDLAAMLHGGGICPNGSQFDMVSGYCREGNDVFGPFPKDLVNKCIAGGGGEVICNSGRWGRDFLIELRGVPHKVDPVAEFLLPEPGSAQFSKSMNLWATNYYLPMVDAVSSGQALRDRRGNSLGPLLTTRDWCNAAMEGSVYVRTGPGSGVTYNYDGTASGYRVSCTHMFPNHPAVGASRFRLAKGQYGDGVQGYQLLPFRTIAVDPGVIPYGSVVYIPAARGTVFQLPDGRRRIHDGYFFAGDTGGAINGVHIDVFTGTVEVGKNVFSWIRSSSSGKFAARIISNESIRVPMSNAHVTGAARAN